MKEQSILNKVGEGIKEILPYLEVKEYPNILDVGCFGRQGQNGSQAIIDSFYIKGNITAMSYKNLIPHDIFKEGKIKHIEGDYFSQKISSTYDLIYFDLGWEGQLKMIETELETLMYERLNDGGYLIFYMFTNNNYGHAKQIQDNLNNFWGVNTLNPSSIIKTINNLNPLYKIRCINTEIARPYITWITLQK
tara:strand:+ start:3893 stop:4468 length:576 start_codon:yes stop_codon:yes gene_type:complete